MTHTLTIPGWRPRTVNELLGNWRRASRLKKADREIIGVAAHQAGIPKAAGRRKVTVTVTVRPQGGIPDGDNLWKSLLDALVHAGMLRDDSQAWCQLGEMGVDRGEPKTVIVLEDV